MEANIEGLIEEINALPNARVMGEVDWLVGLTMGVRGLGSMALIGSRVAIHCASPGSTRNDAPDQSIKGEIIGFRDGQAIVMPYGSLEGIGLGCPVEIIASRTVIHPHMGWLGRVIDARGEPIDGLGPLPHGARAYPVRARAIRAHERRRVGEKIDLGVRGINSFTTLCAGQRLGIFSGTGVGKSILLAMFARHTKADVTVVGLIGERGRELREFLDLHLGPEGRKRAVVIAATADEPALVRREAAHMTLAVSEFFRDQDMQALCLFDNVTRFAMAMREIGLAVGEPPASKAYTPSVFAELPRLLERAGPGAGKGSITGLFSVLVEGDDLNEPISDAVRGILDGHIILSRRIAERGRLPALDPLRSISRSMPNCNTPEQNAIVQRARKLLASYEQMEELIRIGAYRAGSDPEVDDAIACYPKIERFLEQPIEDHDDLEAGYQALANSIGMSYEPGTGATTTTTAAGAGEEAS